MFWLFGKLDYNVSKCVVPFLLTMLEYKLHCNMYLLEQNTTVAHNHLLYLNLQNMCWFDSLSREWENCIMCLAIQWVVGAIIYSFICNWLHNLFLIAFCFSSSKMCAICVCFSLPTAECIPCFIALNSRSVRNCLLFKLF